MAETPEGAPCPLCEIAEVSQGPGDGDQGLWVTCEFSGFTEHYLCHNDHYFEARAEHILSHHCPVYIAAVADAANDTGAPMTTRPLA